MNLFNMFLFAAAAGNDVRAQRLQFYVDIEKLENEFMLTSAEYLLSLANIKWTYSGNFFLILHPFLSLRLLRFLMLVEFNYHFIVAVYQLKSS